MISVFYSLFLGVTLGAAVERNNSLIANCEKPTTAWERMYCNVHTQPEKYQTPLCTPHRKFPLREDGTEPKTFDDLKNVKGVVVFYHGFTACPNHHEEAAEFMRQNGYITLTPLVLGNGIRSGYQCDTPGICIGDNNDNPTFFPEFKDGYIDWSYDVIEMVKEQLGLIPDSAKTKDFTVAAVGLSFGGSLVTFAASRPNTPYNQILAVNPHITANLPEADFKVWECYGTKNTEKCIADILRKPELSDKLIPPEEERAEFKIFLDAAQDALKQVAAKEAATQIGPLLQDSYGNFTTSLYDILATIGDTSSLIQLPIMQNQYGWGKKCEESVDKGGSCNFRVKNLITLQSFGELAVGQLNRVPPTIRFGIINTDLDGAVRDSVTTQIYKLLNGNGVEALRCRYPMVCSAAEYFKDNSDFRCGVPHTCFYSIDAADMYWKRDLHNNILKFVSGGELGAVSAEIKRERCMVATETLGVGEVFDRIGPKYIENARKRYGYLKF